MKRKQTESENSLLKKKALKVRKKKTKLVPRETEEDDSENVPQKRNNRGENNRGNSEHMSKIRQMRKVYNKQMPKLACNNCSFQGSCPKFRAGYECAFIPFLQSHEVKNEKDLMAELKNVVTANVQRMHLAATFETLGGGSPSMEVTEQMNGVFNQMKELYTLMMDTEESETELSNEETIVGQLFGDLSSLVGSVSEAQEEIDSISDTEQFTEESDDNSVTLDGETFDIDSNQQNEKTLIDDYSKEQLESSVKSDSSVDKIDDTDKSLVVVSDVKRND